MITYVSREDERYGYLTLYVNGIPVRAIRKSDRGGHKERDAINNSIARRVTAEFNGHVQRR